MDREELLKQWRANNERPQWVRANRETLEAHIDTQDPIPTSGTAAVADWVSRYKSTVTRQLKPDDAESDEVAA
jgi:hypothetical protein